MTACFKLLAVLVVFLCLYCHEAEAQKKEWMKGIADRFKDAKKMLSSKFSREALDNFLNFKPKLWAEKVLSDAQKLLFKSSMGAKMPSDEELERLSSLSDNNQDDTIHNHASVNLPVSFDSRTAWPMCPGIKEIASQTQCGCCWAVASSSAISDRICIQTNGTRKVRISAMDLMSCCKKCQADGNDGCNGGYVAYAYEYFQLSGVVTGGPYGDKFSCKPFKWAPDANSGFGTEFKSPVCEAKCTTPLDYNTNRHYGTNNKYITPGDVNTMQQQIYSKGPIAVTFMVTESFMRYNGGIFYKSKDNDTQVGGHCVRLIGWGEEKGVPYWIGANSWGPNWGEGGTFRIIRGRNEFDIEKYAVAGEYDQRRSASA